MRRILPGLIALTALLIAAAMVAAVPPVPQQGPVVPTRQPTPADVPPPPEEDDANDENDDEILNTLFPIEDIEQVEIGDRYEGDITPDEHYATAVQFEGRPGQTIDIVTDTGGNELDTVLILLNPEGEELARNDDPRVGETDAVMYGVTLPDEGIYTVIVSGYRNRFGFTEGEFELSIEEADTNSELSPPLTAIRTSYDVEQSQELNGDEGYARTHTFYGQEGEVISISANTLTEGMDPSVILTDSAGNEIYFNDDINTLTDYDAYISGYVLPYTGYYTVVVESFGETDGEYELFIEEDGRLPVEEHSRLTIVPMDRDQSETLFERNTGILSTGFFVGDRLVEESGEDLRVQAVLTYYIPPNTPEIEEAILDLSECDAVGPGFDIIGGYNVYMDNKIDFLWMETPFRPAEDAELIGSFTECSEIDVTEAIQAAHENEELPVHFRIIAQSVMADGETDAVVFLDPRLTLLHERR